MSAAADKNAPELKTLGRYNIERVLGKGAMGVVYEGVDPRLGRRVAIKTILKSHLDEDTGKDFAMRFVREAQAVARLNHPNIVQVYDFGEENNIAYLVMEFIKGKELKNFFDANERFDLKECVRIMGELCEALEFAHAAGIIHRDIKPANVMIDSQGRTKLTDFGVARVQDSDKTSVERTQAGTMVGTPAYMSPEQITGGTIDKRTDVFSAGIILYQFLTGEKPFTGSGAWTIAKKIIQEEPPAPSTLNNAVTPIFDAVVNKALSKDPATRFQSARELGLALQRALEGRGAEDDSERTVVGPMTGAPIAKAPAPGLAGASAQGTGATKTTTGTQSNQEVELEFWRAIKDGNDPDDFELYIQQFPAGIYAALAKRKIAKLRGEPLDDTSLKAKEQEKKEQEEAARREAEAKTKLEADKARLEAEMARKEEEYKKREAEAEARRQELEKQRLAAEEKAKQEAAAEREKVRLEAEKARQEAAAERERAKAEAEKFKREAAEKAAKELAAEREKARLEAERAKKEASEAAERAKKEAAAAAEKAKKDADAFAKKQAEERAKREAEFKKREAELKAQAAAGGKKSSPVVPAIIGVVVLAVAGTGYWFLRPDDKAQKAQLEAMQRQLDEAKKKAQELEVAKKKEEEARLALVKAKEAEEAARKSGDLAKQKELAEARARAEAEARKSADATRAREDDAKRSAAAAEKARAEQDRLAATKKAAEKSAADKAEAERLARERAAAEKALAEAKAQAERAIADARAAAEKAAAEKAAAEKAAAEAKAQAAKAQVAAAPSSGDMLFTKAAALEEEGKGRDAVKAYTQAARSGSGKAAKRLGEIYDKGLIGISRDYAESLKWYNAARVLGEDVPMARSR
jgi:serine/threonine-protein kinase